MARTGFRLRLLASISLLAAPLAGCVDRLNPDFTDDAGVADLALTTPRDLAVIVPRDLSTSGSTKDLAAAAADLAVPQSNCVAYTTWPNIGPQGGYDPTATVTWVASGDTNTATSNALYIEDYQTTGETYPKAVTFSQSSAYASCEVCATIALCDANGCTGTYFAQAGSVTVTQADRNAKTGQMIATAKNLKLVEWDFAQDLPLQGGKCITVASASFNVKWGGTTTTDGGVADLAVPVDMAGPPGDLAGADLSGDMTQPPNCHPVINEVQTEGASPSDEWIEIYNPCSGVDFTGWKIGYRSAGNNSGKRTADVILYTFSKNFTGEYILIAGSGFKGTKTDLISGSGMSASGGAVALYDASDIRVDAVAYKTLTTTNNFTETSPAPNPPTSQSIARTPNGTDTNNNSVDFKVATKPTPLQPN